MAFWLEIIYFLRPKTISPVLESPEPKPEYHHERILPIRPSSLKFEAVAAEISAKLRPCGASWAEAFAG